MQRGSTKVKWRQSVHFPSFSRCWGVAGTKGRRGGFIAPEGVHHCPSPVQVCPGLSTRVRPLQCLFPLSSALWNACLISVTIEMMMMPSWLVVLVSHVERCWEAAGSWLRWWRRWPAIGRQERPNWKDYLDGGRRGTGLVVQVVQWKAEIASWAAHGAKYQAPPANRTPGQNSSWGFTWEDYRPSLTAMPRQRPSFKSLYSLLSGASSRGNLTAVQERCRS